MGILRKKVIKPSKNTGIFLGRIHSLKDHQCLRLEVWDVFGGILFPRFLGCGETCCWIIFFGSIFFRKDFLLIPKKTGKKDPVKSKGLGFVGLGYEVTIFLLKNDVAPW